MPQTNSVDTNSPPRQREAGSPCVFVVIYRVSPARLSDCICLCGALPCSHFTPSRLPSLQTCRPYKTLVLLRSATVCMRVSWPNVTLQGSSFGIWAFSKRLNSCLSALFLNHFHFSGKLFLTCEILWDRRRSSPTREQHPWNMQAPAVSLKDASLGPASVLHRLLLHPAACTNFHRRSSPLWLTERFASSFLRLSSSPSWAVWQQATNL